MKLFQGFFFEILKERLTWYEIGYGNSNTRNVDTESVSFILIIIQQNILKFQ